MSAAELSRQIDVPVNRVTGIINGQRGITADTALRLAHWFGTSPQFWMNLQQLYELRLAEAEAGAKIAALPASWRGQEGLTMKLLFILTAAAFTAGPTVAAIADDLYARYFADADGGKPCYARYYDLAHLRAHPKQTVRRIEVDFDKNFGEGADPKNSCSELRSGHRFHAQILRGMVWRCALL